MDYQVDESSHVFMYKFDFYFWKKGNSQCESLKPTQAAKRVAPLSMWLIWGSNLEPSVCKADDNHYTTRWTTFECVNTILAELGLSIEYKLNCSRCWSKLQPQQWLMKVWITHYYTTEGQAGLLRQEIWSVKLQYLHLSLVPQVWSSDTIRYLPAAGESVHAPVRCWGRCVKAPELEDMQFTSLRLPPTPLRSHLKK